MLVGLWPLGHGFCHDAEETQVDGADDSYVRSIRFQADVSFCLDNRSTQQHIVDLMSDIIAHIVLICLGMSAARNS